MIDPSKLSLYARQSLGILAKKFRMDERASAWTPEFHSAMTRTTPEAVAELLSGHPELQAHAIPMPTDGVWRVEAWPKGAERTDGDISLEGRNGLDLFLCLSGLVGRMANHQKTS